MGTETMSATRKVDAAADEIFAVLADPSSHAAIDGTGWVCEPLDAERLTTPGQLFGMAMYHENHPQGGYRMHNRVQVFEPSRAISWEPGQYGEDGTLGFGGWFWRYDLVPVDAHESEVTLTYDWSAVPEFLRQFISFPPMGEDHLERSLDNLAVLATSRATA
jgi:Polyketide cyclase / dehydrase and lipid transport